MGEEMMVYLSFAIAGVLLLFSVVFAFQKPATMIGNKTTRSASRKSGKAQQAQWQQVLEKELNKIEKYYPNQLGIYIKDLKTGEEFARRSNELWYMSSGIKIPVALEALKQVDEGVISLNQTVELTEDDYVDGGGTTNLIRPGTGVTVEHLIEQMLIKSDNTASDTLTRLVGLDHVNELIQFLTPTGFNRITSQKDIRRLVYSEIHPEAMKLSGREFMQLRNISQVSAKLEKFAKILGVKKNQLKLPNVHQAFMEYYKKNLNSATLRSYGRLLEYAVDDRLLSKTSREFLIDTLLQSELGPNRLKKGLSRVATFAHKSGTQYMRVSDFGFIWSKNAFDEKPVIVAVCTKNFPSVDAAERVLRHIGQAVQVSGVI